MESEERIASASRPALRKRSCPRDFPLHVDQCAVGVQAGSLDRGASRQIMQGQKGRHGSVVC
jgi:hypothetical protein